MSDGLSWLRRTVSRLRARRAPGDVIAASVEEGARGVAVGKNIIQIGSVIFPAWLLAAVLLGVAAAPLAIWMATTPARMGGAFNIAVADFGTMGEDGRVHASAEGKLLGRWVFDALRQEYALHPEMTQGLALEMWHDSLPFTAKRAKIGFIADEKAARAKAKQIGASVLIYGYLDRTHGFEPQFYKEILYFFIGREALFLSRDASDEEYLTQAEQAFAEAIRIGQKYHGDYDHGYKWPNGKPMTSGFYKATISVAADGPAKSAFWFFTFVLDLPNAVRPVQSNLVARILAPTETTVTADAFAFRVEAYDPAVGTRDGAGIARVEMRVLGPDGQEVHRRTENTAGYCVFGGGEPTCNRWDFAAHDGRWPGGAILQRGVHTLQATVQTHDGRTTSVSMVVEIRP